MIQLPAGSTGFFEADAVQEHVGQTEFLRLGYCLSQEDHGVLREVDTDLCGKNFYAAEIIWNQGQETLLMNAYTGHLVYSGEWRTQPIRFPEFPARLAAQLPEERPLSQTFLEQSPDRTLQDLTPAEWEQLRHWKAGTIGEILFNF